MKTTNKNIAIIAALAALAIFPAITTSAFAVDEVNVASGGTLQGPGVAVHGYDVVSYHSGTPVAGNAQYSMAYEGGTYRFANAENLKTFKADPAKYIPAYGGYCAFGVALGKKFDGNPKNWKIVDGRLYLNLNDDIQEKWAADISGNLKKSETRWSKIRSVAAGKL